MCGALFRSCGAAAPGALRTSAPSGADFIIDAGHGGIDGGAEAPNGTKEKELNLALSASIRDIFDILGYDVIMTRYEDIMLSDEGRGTKKQRDLRARLDIAETNPDAVFISIHMNKFPDSRSSGLQVWYSPNNEKSRPLAAVIRAEVKQYISPNNNREIKEAGSNIYLLDRIENPAVLVECGFLSNSSDMALLSDPVYRRRLASVIVLAAARAGLEGREQEQIK